MSATSPGRCRRRVIFESHQAVERQVGLVHAAKAVETSRAQQERRKRRRLSGLVPLGIAVIAVSTTRLRNGMNRLESTNMCVA